MTFRGFFDRVSIPAHVLFRTLNSREQIWSV